MKKLIIGLFFAIPFSAIACPDISGKYRCPKDAQEVGLHRFEIEFVDNIRTFIFKANKLTSFYEINVWNPDYGPTSTKDDLAYMTRVECRGQTVTFMTQDIFDDEITYTHLTPQSGALLVEFEEYSFLCKKEK